jgi:hypothetical protein
MIQLLADIEYRDGNTEPIEITQYAVSRWALYCVMQGWKLDPENPGLAGVTQLRYMAWAEWSRDKANNVSFDSWDRTVTAVNARDDGQEPDPIKPGPSVTP